MAPITSRQNWFIKYKLYHIPFWLLYSYLLWSLEIGSLYEAAGIFLFCFCNQVFLLCALSGVRRLFQLIFPHSPLPAKKALWLVSPFPGIYHHCFFVPDHSWLLRERMA